MLGTHDIVVVATALERNRMVSMGVESELSDKTGFCTGFGQEHLAITLLSESFAKLAA